MDRDEQTQLNIRIDPDLHHRLRTISQAEERSISQTIRYALRQYVSAFPAR